MALSNNAKEDIDVLTLSPLKEKLIVIGIEVDIEDIEGFIDRLSRFFEGEIVQALDGDVVLNPVHLQAAVFNALYPDPKAEEWIKSPELRILAYLSCDRQVVEALRI